MKRSLGRLTIRGRLTLMYGGLVLLAGVVLLGVTYVLVAQRLPGGHAVIRGGEPFVVNQDPRAVLGQSVEVNGVSTLVAELPQQLKQAALGSLLTQGAIALAVVFTAALGIGWLVAGRALSPLHRITDTAGRIARAPAADRGLHERIALAGPRDELKELADTFDTMLERLDQAFDGQRRFVANASHELRTPLTLNRSLIEVAMRRPSASEDVRRLGEVLLDVNSRNERLIEGLLLLARSGNELTSRSYLDMSDVVEHVVTLTDAEAAAAGVTITASRSEAPVLGDAVLLERMVQNLVENGIRHNQPAHGWVRVHVRTEPSGWAEVAVSNTGRVVPGYDTAGLFEPFRRSDSDRLAGGQGVGLGLSIVRSVARAHGGDVHAEPRPGGGLTVSVRLPLAPTQPTPIVAAQRDGSLRASG
jgi:signal transduction histidine kinase